MNNLIAEVTKDQLKADRDNFKIGDGVRVHTRVKEGDKERVQIFSGIVIMRKGVGIQETFTVRRFTLGEGVERIFPLHSPNIIKIEVERESVRMKARLFYLRKRKGKEANKVKAKAFVKAAKGAAVAK